MSNSSCRTIEQSLQEYGRGVAGGLIFSLPLLFTMEMWWIGFIAHPARLVVGLLGTFVLLLGYNRFAGLRNDASFGEVVIDSIEELGIGLVISAATLFLLGRVHVAQPINEIMGQVVVEAMTIAIGVSVGTAQLGGGDDDGDSGMADDDKETSYGGQVILALCGAFLFASNVAPTEEIILLAIENRPLHIGGIALLSLALSALIVEFSEFRGSHSFTAHGSLLIALRSVIVTYAVALIASCCLLWFFGRFEGNSFFINLSQVVVLAFPAALGASAGRLLVQGNQGNQANQSS
jgi:putative integral membrane protein (TIGR02587 family)